jgi:hypothetical protein
MGMTRREKVLNPDDVEFEGSLNDLQNAYAETRRMRIRAEEKLAALKKEDDEIMYQIQAGFVNLCREWEEKLEADLHDRFPEGQSRLTI